MIAASPSVAYIHEPFHLHHDLNVCGARVDCWFTYVCEENEALYSTPIADMLDAVRYRAAAGDERSCVRPLIKDPLALFSAGWLASRFNTRNVVMIRHPAAFAASLKAKQWTHPFVHFLQQPLLMQHHLEPFARELMRFTREPQDIVDQAALLWTMIHSMILKYQEAFPEWMYVRHEDLSRSPIEGFRGIFDHLDLEWSAETARTIAAHSFPAAEGVPSMLHDLTRDSLAIIDTWKMRLTGDEIERVRSRVWNVSTHFYSEQEW
jgi:hypothetical protein